MSVLGLDWIIFTGCGIAVTALSVAFVLIRGIKLSHIQETLKSLRNNGNPFGSKK